MIKRVLRGIFIVIFYFYCSSPLITLHAKQADTDLISLDLKGMEIRDVLRILSQKSGLNIIADNDVKANVTIYIKDVSVMDALDIIALTTNLAYEENGSLIRVMTDREYEMEHGKKFKERTKTEVVHLNYVSASEVSKVVANMKTNIGKIISDDASNTIILIDVPENIEKMKAVILETDVPLVTEVFSIDYAKAESIKGKLEQMISKGAGSINFDERTNKLVVRDTPRKMQDIRCIVEAFDEKTRQVLIDANIVQVTLSDKYSYGIDWTSVLKAGDVKLTGDGNISSGLTNATPSTLTVATLGGNYKAIMSLLKTFGETNVLSRPRITVLNNGEAKIMVGSKEVYVSSEVTTTEGGTYHTTDHIQFVDVGVTLAVVPTINKAGFVTMKIKPEVSNADATKTVALKNPDGSTRTIVPYVTSSEAETVVSVKDNTTIIIGGLMKDTIVDNKEKIPLLGDIPFLGKLFSTTGKSKEKTELVIFLTPHIIEGDKTSEEVKSYMDSWEEKVMASRIERKSNKNKDIKEINDTGKEKPSSFNYESLYDKYYSLVVQKIDDIMQGDSASISTEMKGEVELQFTLNKDGFLTEGPFVVNNPDSQLIRSSLDCVKKAVPFPPFPKDLGKEEEEFDIVVSYE